MSRKRLKPMLDETREWRERQQRERDEARRISEAQLQRQIPPGYRRLTIEDEI